MTCSCLLYTIFAEWTTRFSVPERRTRRSCGPRSGAFASGPGPVATFTSHHRPVLFWTTTCQGRTSTLRQPGTRQKHPHATAAAAYCHRLNIDRTPLNALEEKAPPTIQTGREAEVHSAGNGYLPTNPDMSVQGSG